MIRISHLELRRVAERTLVGAGADSHDASVVSEVLVWADRRGRFAQGTIWLEVLCERVSRQDIRSPATMTTTATRPAAMTMDAGQAFGHVAARRATDWVAHRAVEFGVATASIRNSSHFGACGHHADQLTGRGLIAIVATNAYPKVAPYGARTAVIGTNPIGFAAPAGPDPSIIGDLSTGAIAGSRIREARADGRELDVGTALDSTGRPTRDVAAFEDGGVMLPFGGPKGSALGILVEILTSVLAAGAAPSDLGSMFEHGPTGTSHFVLAIAGPPDLQQRVGRLRDAILDAPARADMEVRLPGDAGHSRFEREQIDLPDSTVDSIDRTMRRFTPESPRFSSRARNRA